LMSPSVDCPILEAQKNCSAVSMLCKFASVFHQNPISMEVVLLESEAYKQLQQTNINLIRSLIESERKDPPFGWVSHKQATELLDASPRTMQNWRDDGLLGFSQVGKKIYYSHEDIDRMLRRHYHKPFKAAA
jgi:hypothetical protein